MGGRRPAVVAAGVSAALLALVQLEVAVGGGLPTYARLLLLVCGAATALAAWHLHLGDAFEARLSVAVCGLAAVAGSVLSAVVGLPGAAPTGATPWGTAAALLGLAAAACVSLDRRPERARADYLSTYGD